MTIPTMRAIGSPRGGQDAFGGVGTAAPIGISHDGAPPDLIHRHALGIEGPSRGHRDRAGDEVGMTRRPFQGLEAADRAANGDEPTNAKMIDEGTLSVDDVADRNERKPHAVGPPR